MELQPQAANSRTNCVKNVLDWQVVAQWSLSCCQSWAGRAGTELWEPHLRASLSGFQLQNISLPCNPIYLFIISLLDVKLLQEPPPHSQPGLCEGQDTGTPATTPGVTSR